MPTNENESFSYQIQPYNTLNNGIPYIHYAMPTNSWIRIRKNMLNKHVDLHNMQQAMIYTRLLKSDSHLPKKFLFICFKESLLKMMKNVFYFILKALFVFKIFKILPWHFDHIEETAQLER